MGVVEEGGEDAAVADGAPLHAELLVLLGEGDGHAVDDDARLELVERVGVGQAVGVDLGGKGGLWGPAWGEKTVRNRALSFFFVVVVVVVVVLLGDKKNSWG